MSEMNEYTLLDSGNFRKLEQVGPVRVDRPAPQAAWLPSLGRDHWQAADASFARFSGGTGQWTVHNKKLPDTWTIEIPEVGSTGAISQMIVKRSGFGHLGIFPEQLPYWQRLHQITSKARGTDFSVLNLFAYTGGATLACALGGAAVVHVDASKPTVAWAHANATASGLAEAPIRWIVDDVQKFVAREVRRSRRYQGIILDPPSYGRGSSGQAWKIEKDLPLLLFQLKELLANDFAFIHLSAHSDNFSPLVLENLVRQAIPNAAGSWLTEEMTIPSNGGLALPSGASTLFTK